MMTADEGTIVAHSRATLVKHKPTPAAPRPTAALWRWMIVFGLIGALVVGLIVLQVGCAQSQSKPQRDEFASDRGGDKKDVKPVTIDGKRTMGYLEAVCKIGPRISGSEGMKKQQELIEKHFDDLGGKVRYQKFTAKQRGRKATDMANLIVSYHPDRARRVILCSHYDTRPIADQEDDQRQWTKPFVSANDGGTGVALLMELAHHVKDLDTSVGIDFVLFDGEEYVFDRDDTYFFGSKHFAKEYAKIKRKTTYTGAILLDMIGGKSAKFPVEQNSALKAGKLTKEVWSIAAELKCDRFKNEYSRTEILDDHIPLNAGGIPAIDIIDFDYPHWHKLTDVPKNCSAEPMEQVAKVLSVWIQRQK
jgi:glutaminyl-peptide cyclotransferase